MSCYYKLIELRDNLATHCKSHMLQSSKYSLTVVKLQMENNHLLANHTIMPVKRCEKVEGLSSISSQLSKDEEGQ